MFSDFWIVRKKMKKNIGLVNSHKKYISNVILGFVNFSKIHLTSENHRNRNNNNGYRIYVDILTGKNLSFI